MLLSELFDAPELGLHLLHAARGAYDLPIGRLVTADEESLAAQAVSAGERLLARHRDSAGYISATR